MIASVTLGCRAYWRVLARRRCPSFVSIFGAGEGPVFQARCGATVKCQPLCVAPGNPFPQGLEVVVRPADGPGEQRVSEFAQLVGRGVALAAGSSGTAGAGESGRDVDFVRVAPMARRCGFEHVDLAPQGLPVAETRARCRRVRRRSRRVFFSPPPPIRRGIFQVGSGFSQASRRSIRGIAGARASRRWPAVPNGLPYSSKSSATSLIRCRGSAFRR